MQIGRDYSSLLCPEIIDSYWVYKCESTKIIQTRIFPQGLAKLIFYFNESRETGTCLDNGFPYIFISGEITGSFPFFYNKNDFYIVAHIKSIYLSALLKVNMESITDKTISLEDIDKKLWQRLRRCATAASIGMKLRAIDRELYLLFNNIPDPDTQLSEIIELAFSSKGRCSLNELLDCGNISVRTMERKFLKVVGLPPKTFTRIIRFYNILHYLKSQESCSLIETALYFGYYDQAHFNNDFKKISGYAPSFFISQ